MPTSVRTQPGSGRDGASGPDVATAVQAGVSALPFAFLTAAVMVAVAGLAAAGRRPSEVVIGMAFAFLPYAFLLVRRPPRHALPWAIGMAAVAGAAMVAAPAALSDDVHRYLWDAKVLLAGIDPYAYAPDDPALRSLRDTGFGHINHPHIPTIYPPLAQLLFAIAAAISAVPATAKALALGAHLCTVPIVGALARHLGDGSRTRGDRAILLFALNPLALGEAALGGHVDAAAALALAAAILLLLRRRPFAAAWALGAAAGVKLVGILLMPLLIRSDRRSAWLALALGIASVVPLVSAGGGSGRTGGLGHYARRWEGNAGGYVLVLGAATGVVDGAAWLSGSPPGHLEVPALGPLLRMVEGGPADPRAGLLGPKKSRNLTDFHRDFAAGLLARAISLGLLALLAWSLYRRKTEPIMAARWLFLTGLLLAPQVHPWYLVWLLPFEVAGGRYAGLIWSAAVLIAYGPLDGWNVSREWHEPGWARVFEYLAVVAALLVEARIARKIRVAALVQVG